MRRRLDVSAAPGQLNRSAACAYSLMNKPEQAIKWLQTAADNGFPCYSLFESDPYLNPLREDSRFVTIMMRLKEQWKGYKALS